MGNADVQHYGVTLVYCLTFSLRKCFLLPYLRHISITKICGLLQLIIICTFTQFL